MSTLCAAEGLSPMDDLEPDYCKPGSLGLHLAREQATSLVARVVEEARAMLVDHDEVTVWRTLRANLVKAMELTDERGALAADLLTAAVITPAKQPPR
jgi:hypothetical protein